MRPVWYERKDVLVHAGMSVTEISIITQGEAMSLDSDGLPLAWLEPGEYECQTLPGSYESPSRIATTHHPPPATQWHP